MTTKSQKEWRKKWVKALRSGEYKQTSGVLRDGDEFCCLGVACDISELSGWDEGNVYLFEQGVLPNAVRELYGLERSDGEFVGDCLTVLNDNGASFQEIADIIESEPEGLFND